MEPVYIDIHIHTSDDPNNLDPDYNIELLVQKINEFTGGSKLLLALSDHNTVNKSVYLKANELVENLLIGVELHVLNYSSRPPYHCHILFNVDQITEDVINDINAKLDVLYPNKVIDTETENIPQLEEIIKIFDSYEFLFLPHGGQSHRTFDKSIPEDVEFDSTMERSIYYNQFDGFTARGNTGLERTQSYFKRLGINEFVNLITCTDNYNPTNYPNAKSSEAKPFVPTWMFALPTYNGLRLSLSEPSRLHYSDEKPSMWSEHIKEVKLNNDTIDLDVVLTPGLNVVIGGSSSGKTLFVDSVNNKIKDDFSESNYLNYGVERIRVENPANVNPHYLSQNYIMSIVNSESENDISDIDIIKTVFPGDQKIKDVVDRGLSVLKADLKELIKQVKLIETHDKILGRIPKLTRLITSEDVKSNVISTLVPSEQVVSPMELDDYDYEEYKRVLDELDKLLTKNPLVEHNPFIVPQLMEELALMFSRSEFEAKIRSIIIESKKEYDDFLRTADNEAQSKKQNFDKLIESVTAYSKAYLKFFKILEKISSYSFTCDSEEVESMGHKLFIANSFELNKDKLLEVINKYLKNTNSIGSFNDITPESLFERNYRGQMPNVRDYDDFELKVTKKFEELNKKTYKIITDDGRAFENLSAGWKTSVILDIILGFKDDVAPIIIDQPEDNLATNYINKGLVKAIKKIKSAKQVILVSHNATIPMLGDAQNIILCKNDRNKITIRSNPLEGYFDGKSAVDYVAEITDGGKPSIKKRVKKYNLKNFKEEL
jgi:hypothetical protein